MTTPTAPESKRPSTQLRIVSVLAGLVSQFIVGLIFITGGGSLVRFSISKEPHNATLLWTGVAVAVGGALCLPSILPIAEEIYAKFFPNGLPFLGKKPAA